MLDCYIINLDRSRDRWELTSQKFQKLGFNVIRIPAISGKDLTFPHPDFAAWRYFFFYGRKMYPNKVACYLSHIRAIRTFLESGKDHAMICEDDVTPDSGLAEIIQDAMKYAHSWDLLRLNGGKQPSNLDFAQLSNGYSLCSDLRYTSGNGGKVINRTAAEKIVKKLMPMRMPHDVTLYYDWPIGIREASVKPFPIHFNPSGDSIIGEQPKYPVCHPAVLRYLSVFPYRYLSRGTRLIQRLICAWGRCYFPPKPKN